MIWLLGGLAIFMAVCWWASGDTSPILTITIERTWKREGSAKE